jgi:hypothetical protein
MWDALFPYVAALLPTVAVAVLFYFLIKTILEGDRRERLAQSKWEKEQEKEQGRDTPKKSR